MNQIMRHTLGLIHGQTGSSFWKRYLSENMCVRDADVKKIDHIMDKIKIDRIGLIKRTSETEISMEIKQLTHIFTTSKILLQRETCFVVNFFLEFFCVPELDIIQTLSKKDTF